MSESSKSPESWQTIRQRHKAWALPFVWIEWVTEWLVYLLGRWAFIDLVKLVASLSIVWAAASYLLSADERRQAQLDQRKAKHYQAWQVINSAQGKGGSGGRIDALQDLAADQVSLVGIDLSGAILDRIQLPGANLAIAKLDSAHLSEACLKEVTLSGATMKKTSFVSADLSNAILSNSDFREANLAFAELGASTLLGSDLRGAVLPDSIKNVSELYDANIYGAKAPHGVEDFFKWAIEKMGAVCIGSDQEWQTYREASSRRDFKRPKFDPTKCAPDSLVTAGTVIVADPPPVACPTPSK
jgi:uncharacterized protein YjbI with pentapeptide repeats